MLKELNRIAAGLMGLHGYPTEPWSAVAADAQSRREAAPTAGRRDATTRKTTVRPARKGRLAQVVR